MIVQEAIGTRLFDGESILFFREMFDLSLFDAFKLNFLHKLLISSDLLMCLGAIIVFILLNLFLSKTCVFKHKRSSPL